MLPSLIAYACHPGEDKAEPPAHETRGFSEDSGGTSLKTEAEIASYDALWGI